jgi:hypothetical protein
LEVLVVVVLVATVSLIAMPRFQALLSPDLGRDVQRELENLLLAVRQESVLSRAPLAVVYNLREGIYRSALLNADGTLDVVGDPVALLGRLPPGVRFTDISTPREDRTTQGEAFTMVWPTGWIEPTTIHIRDERDQPYTLVIEPLSGAVRLEEGYLVRRKVSL